MISYYKYLLNKMIRLNKNKQFKKTDKLKIINQLSAIEESRSTAHKHRKHRTYYRIKKNFKLYLDEALCKSIFENQN